MAQPLFGNCLVSRLVRVNCTIEPVASPLLVSPTSSHRSCKGNGGGAWAAVCEAAGLAVLANRSTGSASRIRLVMRDIRARRAGGPEMVRKPLHNGSWPRLCRGSSAPRRLPYARPHQIAAHHASKLGDSDLRRLDVRVPALLPLEAVVAVIAARGEGFHLPPHGNVALPGEHVAAIG